MFTSSKSLSGCVNLGRKVGLVQACCAINRNGMLRRKLCSDAGERHQHDDLNFLDGDTLDEGVPIKDIFCNAEGNPIFEYDRTNPMGENYDWTTFERAFGLDKLHDVDFEEWEPRSSENCVSVDGSEGSIKEAAMLMASVHMANLANDGAHTAAQFVEDDAGFENEKELDEIVARALTNSNKPDIRKDPVSHKFSDITSHIVDTQHSAQQTFSRTTLDDGSTKKVGRAQQLKKRFPERKAVKKLDVKKEMRSPGSADSAHFEEIIRVPENAKKPGYERRIRSLEVQMERIATEVLCIPGCEFHDVGATMHHTLLSPDGFTLSIFFDLDGVSSKKLIQDVSIWSSRLASKVRAELSKRLYAKRVPTVKLVLMGNEKLMVETATASMAIQGNHLDALFDQIAAERKQKGEKRST